MNRVVCIILFAVTLCISSCNGGKTIYEEQPPSISLSSTYPVYQVALNNEITISPIIENYDNAVYVWKIGSTTIGTDKQLVFKGETTGLYNIVFNVTTEYGEASADIKVIVYDTDTYRPFDNNSSSSVTDILTYMPAPGQFINDNGAGFSDITTMEEANRYVEQRFKESKWVSLGAFGGYLIGKFDHSVFNDGGYNIAIIGNAITTMSEPGIVWVMSDENKNGEADDTWYQLKGSDFDSENTISDYSVTYYRPTTPKADVEWTDNLGGSGTVDHLSDYHDADTYYPLWIESDTYTLSGVRLEAHNVQDAMGFWSSTPYGWGYADNYSDIDGTQTSEGYTNYFKINNAVDAEGENVHLQSVDFIKIQTGVNGKSGILGELSTEIVGIIDYNLIK